MPPACIFVVRHGERQDQANPGFSKSTPRPHDPPLSIDGVNQSRALGRLLRSSNAHTCLPPHADQWVVLSSPLQRCVQTASYMLDECRGDADMLIHLEPCLVEVRASLMADCRKNPSLSGHIPTPLWLPLETIVKRVPLPTTTKLAPSVTGSSTSAVNAFSGEGGSAMPDDDHDHRVSVFLDAVKSQTSLDGKSVVIVTHAQIARSIRRQLVGGCPDGDDGHDALPALTAFMCFQLSPPCSDHDAQPTYRALQPAFVTPHLSA